MSRFRFLTAGESHGRGLTGIIEGVPSGIPVSAEEIDKDLRRRQGGHGRGGRMKIESDHAEILSGVRWGETLGSPISLLIENKDWKNWEAGMSAEAGLSGSIKPVTRPRPGHADLAGALKFGHRDMRNILERSSARETAMRVGLGAIAKRVLSEFNVAFGSYVMQIGTVRAREFEDRGSGKDLLQAFAKAEKSSVRCPDEEAAKSMVKLIDKAIKEGDSLGGIFEVFITGLPPGLGSHVQWDRRLDGRLAQAMMSIQAMKGVEVGGGFEMCGRSGSEVMDEIFYKSLKQQSRSHKVKAGFYRKTNNAGGLEGGMTNGMPVIIRVGMKPIPTLRSPLMSVDINTKKPFSAAYERSDVCAVPAAAVVGEAMAALIIADVFLEKFGGDSRDEVARNYQSYLSYLKAF
jgi:chorismate synthase